MTTDPITRTDTRTLTRWFDRAAAANPGATPTDLAEELEDALAAAGYAARYEIAGDRMRRDRAADIMFAWLTDNGVFEDEFITDNRTAYEIMTRWNDLHEKARRLAALAKEMGITADQSPPAPAPTPAAATTETSNGQQAWAI